MSRVTGQKEAAESLRSLCATFAPDIATDAIGNVSMTCYPETGCATLVIEWRMGADKHTRIVELAPERAAAVTPDN